MVNRFQYICLILTLLIQLAFPIDSTAQTSSATQKALEKAIREIQSSDTSERRRGAYILNDLGIEALPALDYIIRGIEDDDAQVWFQSIDLVAKLGPKAEKAIPTLIKQLKSGGGRYRNQIAYRTAFALGSIGEAAIPSLTQLLDESSPTRRRTAALALGWIKPKATDAVPKLLELLDDQDQEVRYAVVETFGRIGEPAIAPIVSVLKTSSIPVKLKSGLQALGRIGPSASKAQNAVSKFLASDSDSEVKLEAIKTLGSFRLKGEVLISYLDSEMNSKDPLVWEACLQSLLLCEDKKSLSNWLKLNLTSKNKLVKQRVLSLVERIGPDASGTIPQLVTFAYNTEDSTTSDTAKNALKLIGKDSFLPLIIEVAPFDSQDLNDSMWQIQVVRSIGHLAVPDVTTALDSDFGAVKWTALDIIENRKIQSNQIQNRVSRLTNDTEAAVRAKALLTLIALELPARQLTPIIQRLIIDPDQSVQQLAVASIPALGNSASSLQDSILNGLNSEEMSTRILYLNAITALPSIPKQIIDQLEKGLLENPKEEQIAKISAFGKMGQKASSTLETILEVNPQGNSELEKSIILTLPSIAPSDARVTQHIEKYFTSENQDFKLVAYQVLNKLPLAPEKKVQFIEKGLADKNQSIREISAGQIARLGTKGRLFAPQLFKMLKNKNDDHTFIIESLKAIRATEVPLYVESLSNSETSVRLFAAEALGRMGGKAESALPALRKVSQDDDYLPVRRTASTAIRNIIRRR